MKPVRKKNPTEQFVVEEYQNAGYQVLAKGWPDLLVFKGKEIFCVEIKRKQKKYTRKAGLSVHQRINHSVLRQAGMDVRVRYIEQQTDSA